MNRKQLIELIEQYHRNYPKDNFACQTLDFINQNENFWQRENLKGHITASAWIVDNHRNYILLTHHHKLNLWVQLGGHVESIDKDIYAASQRELEEESGLENYKLLDEAIFDIDVHLIPTSRQGIPAHFHYDIRLIYEADIEEKIIYDPAESNDVAWKPLRDIALFTNEQSILRMANKTNMYIR